MSNVYKRTAISGPSWDLQPDGRNSSLDKIYIGFVKDSNDLQRLGRLRVWIPEFGARQDDESSWITVTYCAPFAGATNLYDNGTGTSWEDSQTSYGMWFVPPDIDNEVVCAFIAGDPGRGIWWGGLYNQYMNHMVPGIPGNNSSTTLPVSEYNKLNESIDPNTVVRPRYSPLADQLVLQGLATDATRGTSSSGARRSDPVNQVSGILTPGGSQLVFDDNAANSFIRIRTRQGAQIVINDTIGSVYVASRDGLNWIELSGDGFLDIYSENDISLRTQGNMNFRADANIYFDAGSSIYMKARGEAREFNPTIFLDVTDAANNIIGQPAYTYQGNYQISGQTLSTNTVIPPVVPDQQFPATPNTAIQSSNVAVKMSTTNTTIVGDGIAAGLAKIFGNQNITTPGITTASVISDLSKATISNPYVIISTGSNDDWRVVNTVTPYQTVRAAVPVGVKVVWVAPANNRVAAAFQKQIAAQHGDTVVDLYKNPFIPLDSTDVFPKNYADVINQITGSPVLPGTSDPTVANSSSATVPGAIAGGVTLTNGQYIQFKKDVGTSYNGPIFLVEGVGTSIKLVDTGTSDDIGNIKMEAAADIHQLAHENLYQKSISDTHRIAGGATYDTAIGDHQTLSGGEIAVQALGGASIRAGHDILLSGAKVHANGPLAAVAKQAEQADQILDNVLTDVTYDSQSQTYKDRQTSVARMPTHEPYFEHLQVGQTGGVPANGRGAAFAGTNKNLPPLAIITGPHLAWGSKVNSYDKGGATFRGKVWDMASKLGLPPADTLAPNYSGADWLMAVMHLESAGTFSPKVKCGVSSATGLIQFMAATAVSMGTTTAALSQMTPETQLDWVYKYLSVYSGKYQSLTDLYLSVLWPKAIGKADNYILWNSTEAAYRANHGFDTGRKGYVSKSDITVSISKHLIDGLREGNIWKA